MTTNHPKTYAEITSERYAGDVARIARRLRDLAGEVERAGRVRPNPFDVPLHGWRAQQVVHAVISGVANMHLDALTLAAAEADQAAAKEAQS